MSCGLCCPLLLKPHNQPTENFLLLLIYTDRKEFWDLLTFQNKNVQEKVVLFSHTFFKVWNCFLITGWNFAFYVYSTFLSALYCCLDVIQTIMNRSALWVILDEVMVFWMPASVAMQVLGFRSYQCKNKMECLKGTALPIRHSHFNFLTKDKRLNYFYMTKLLFFFHCQVTERMAKTGTCFMKETSWTF